MNLKEGISIVICTFNGTKRLQPTLESIFKQKLTLTVPWELIIIDNASTDQTSEFCKNIIEQNHFQQPYKIIYESQQGCNHARLRGLNEIQYKWLLFCDDDNHLFPDYLEKGWKILQNKTNIGVLGGQGIGLFETTKPDWFDTYFSSFAVGPQCKKNGILPFNDKRKLYSAGSFFHASSLLTYYDNNFTTIMTGPKANELTRGEDTEWCMMIQLMGLDLYYSDDLLFYHLMTASRLNWNYYKLLKKGIASGAAKLSSYDLFFKQKNPSVFGFFVDYFKNCIYFNLVAFQFLIRSNILPFSYSKEIIDIGKSVNYSTAKAYRKDFKITYSHFKQLSSILKLFKKK